MARFLLIVVLLTACSESSLDSKACSDFAALANDADILTVQEQRDRAQSIWNNAQYSDDEALRSASRRMLSSITQSDFTGLEDAVFDMSTACEDVEPF